MIIGVWIGAVFYWWYHTRQDDAVVVWSVVARTVGDWIPRPEATSRHGVMSGPRLPRSRSTGYYASG